jgi:hypothetical protein
MTKLHLVLLKKAEIRFRAGGRRPHVNAEPVGSLHAAKWHAHPPSRCEAKLINEIQPMDLFLAMMREVAGM